MLGLSYSRSAFWRWSLVALVIVAIYIALTISNQFSLTSLQAASVQMLSYVDENPLSSVLLFSAFYFAICVFPTPLISAFTILAGYLFGNVVGLLLVSFMSALGGTVLFLIVRYALRDWVRMKLPGRSPLLQRAINADNFSAALSTRFIPGLPFPIPAIFLALSRLSTLKFYLSTQLGLLVTLAVYVNAGRSFSEVNSLGGIFSPQLLFSLLFLALVPWVLGAIHRGWFEKKDH